MEICTKTNVDGFKENDEQDSVNCEHYTSLCCDDLAPICDVLFRHYGLDLGLDMG